MCGVVVKVDLFIC